MSTPEGKIKTEVKALLNLYGAYYHMPVLNGMGKPSLDFIGCHKGNFFGIETKAANKQPTERQARTMQEMEAAGGKTFVVNAVTGMGELREWLISIPHAIKTYYEE